MIPWLAGGHKCVFCCVHTWMCWRSWHHHQRDMSLVYNYLLTDVTIKVNDLARALAKCTILQPRRSPPNSMHTPALLLPSTSGRSCDELYKANITNLMHSCCQADKWQAMEALNSCYTYRQLKQATVDINAEGMSLGDLPMMKEEYKAIWKVLNTEIW